MSVAKIHQGDCLPFMRTLPDGSCDCLVSDPPYAVGYKNGIYDDSAEVIEKQIPLWFQEWYRLLKDGSYAFLYVGVKNIHKWIFEGENAGFTYRNIIATRSFNNGSMVANNFCFVMQPIIVFCKGKGKSFNKVDFFPTSQEWLKDKRNKNSHPYTYQYPNFIPTDICYGTEVFGGMDAADAKQAHPNAKSVKLEQFLIEISTQPGELVLDPFLGSGTTGVAALQCGREFIGCEMDEHWFQKSCRRLDECNPLFSQVEVV